MILNKAVTGTRDIVCHVIYREFQHAFEPKAVDQIWNTITFHVWFGVWNRDVQLVRDQIQENIK